MTILIGFCRAIDSQRRRTYSRTIKPATHLVILFTNRWRSNSPRNYTSSRGLQRALYLAHVSLRTFSNNLEMFNFTRQKSRIIPIWISFYLYLSALDGESHVINRDLGTVGYDTSNSLYFGKKTTRSSFWQIFCPLFKLLSLIIFSFILSQWREGSDFFWTWYAKSYSDPS